MKKKGRFIWYCLAVAGLNKKSYPKFHSIQETLADILSNNGCSPVCEDELIVFDLQKNKAIKMFETIHDLMTGEIEAIREV